ncbi:MAG: glycerol-3-phosphate 1-O-acyltransferase PlsY [Acidobacteria bacterium]|nr:glycerol-3-phosphate 1-O-acyltransferase PlsY [Acidobacteriota bacterium]
MAIGIKHAWIPLAAYLLGSIPFGYLIARLRGGTDIRAAGSGNIGAANVTRVVGPGAGAMTLLLDAAKGYLAVWLAAHFSDENITWMTAAALAAIAGHLFPIWLGFRGGRGVATGVGVFLPICWPAVVAALVIWIAVVAFWRYVSLGSIVAAAALPLLMYFLYAPGHAPPRVASFGTTLAAVLIIVKHRPNLERLIAGTEPRFTFRR